MRTSLETFVIGAMFDQVLAAANLRLDPMTSGRYRFERDTLSVSGRSKWRLDVRVHDIETGRAREIITLSGGETFIAALSLALALSDIVEMTNGAIRLDTIFIDEGFGSLDRISQVVTSAVWAPTDFLDLGGRDAVDKTLQRLVKWGELRRIDRGLYDKPLFNSLTQQQSAPDPRAVIDAVARRDQIRVLVDGMTAANDLGFTNAVPAKIAVHSEARPKSIKLGNLAITFKHTAASKLHWAGRPAMRVVQALHWLRDTMPGDDDHQWHQRLASLLADPVHGADLRQDRADGMTTRPAWMQDMLRPLIADEASAA